MKGPIGSETGPQRTSMARGSLTLSIVLSTYNERSNLPRLIDAIQSLPLPPHEILVVDDGSTDGTREYLLALAQTDSSIRAILHNGKQTLTPAQCQGIDAAYGDYVVVMDADLQHPPEVVPRILMELEGGKDLVVASRYTRGGSPGNRTMTRGIISRFATFMAKRLVPGARRVTDPVSGYFGFRRSAFHGLNPRYRGYKLLLFVLEMCRFRPVSEVPYRFRERANGHSKITQDWSFVWVFLVEAILARRDGPQLPTPGVPTPRSPPYVEMPTGSASGTRFPSPSNAVRVLTLPGDGGRSPEVPFDAPSVPELSS
jgi:dolichol-phosphate mannosyltransferase